MKNVTPLLLMVCLPFYLFAQPTFKKNYDFNIPCTYESLDQVIGLENGDLVFGGVSGVNSNNYDVMLMKTDGDGNEIWSNRYDHFKDNDVRELIKTPDGGFLLGVNSYTHFLSRVEHSLLIKTNASGDEEWFMAYGLGDLLSVDVLSNGDYLIGILQDEILKAVKVDATGNIIAEIMIEDNTFGRGLSATSDGGFFAYGRGVEHFLKKYDNNLQLEWTNFYDYNGEQIEVMEVIDYNFSEGHALLGRAGFSNNVLTLINNVGDVESQVLLNNGLSFGSFYRPNLIELDDGFLYIRGDDGMELIGNDGISTALSFFDEFDLTNQFFFDAIAATDGNLVITGRHTNADSGSDGFMIKVSPALELLFNRFIGDQEPADFQNARGVAATPDGGFILAGDAYFSGKKGDFTVVKTDASGNILWESTYGGTADEQCHSIVNTLDGGHLLCGGILADEASGIQAQLLIIKIDDEGTEVWQRTFEANNSGNFFGTEAIELSDGSLAVAFPQPNVQFMKLSADGDSLWAFNYDNILRRIRRMRADQNGGFSALYYNNAGRGNLIHVNSDGEINLNVVIDESVETVGLPYGVEYASDGGYMVSGTSNISEGFHITKLDAFGNTEWLNEYDYENYSTFRPYMAKTTDGNYVIITSEFYSEVTPENNSMISLTKVDEQGNEIWTNTLGHDKWFGEFCLDLESTSTGGVVMSGYSIPTNSTDMMLVVTENDGTVKTVQLEPFGSLKLHPAPSNGILSVKFKSALFGKLTISIIDAQGKLLKQYTENKPLTSFNATKNLSFLPSGNYFVRLEIEGRSITRSWIKH